MEFFTPPYPQKAVNQHISAQVRRVPNQRMTIAILDEANDVVCNIGHIHTEGGMPYMQLEDTRASDLTLARNSATGAIIVNDVDGTPLNP